MAMLDTNFAELPSFKLFAKLRVVVTKILVFYSALFLFFPNLVINTKIFFY